MPVLAGDTGNGMMLTLTGFTGDIQSIALPEWAFDMIDASHLKSVDFMEMIPGDLKTPGEAVMQVIFDVQLDVPTFPDIQDATFTFPILDPTNTTPATLAGSGTIRVFGFPEMANQTLQVAPVTFAFDGRGTKPAFTKEAA